MLDATNVVETKSDAAETSAHETKAELPVWEQPKLEEVSEQVMAQPYIRFT
jgi:hypothetical protein